MNKHVIPALLLLATLPWLSACGNETEADLGTGVLAEVSAELSDEMRKVSEDVRQEMATGNIDISESGQPDAEITPQGDLLIGGSKVEITAEQRELLLDYRGHVTEIATTGAAIGIQGASLATSAMSKAFAGVLSGNTDKIEQEIEAEANELAEQALRICELLPPMLETEQQLASSLPEFQPYADLDQTDIDECREGHVEI